MTVLTKEIQKLRQTTGAGVMECKKALEEAGGIYEKALDVIHRRGLAKAGKRSDRETGAGMIESYVHGNRIGVLVDVRAETDFVVHSTDFRVLAKELAMQIAAENPKNVDELLKQPYIREESKSVEDVIKSVAAKVGENIVLKDFTRLEI